MTPSTIVAELRHKHHGFDALPDVLSVPAVPPRRPYGATLPIQEATLDDVAFATAAVEAEFNAVGDRLHALKRLYRLAREAGAVGAERVVPAAVGETR
jgi:hypothetical protein